MRFCWKFAKWGQRMKVGTTFICIHAQDTYHPTTISLLLYPHEGCLACPLLSGTAKAAMMDSLSHVLS